MLVMKILFLIIAIITVSAIIFKISSMHSVDFIDLFRKILHKKIIP